MKRMQTDYEPDGDILLPENVIESWKNRDMEFLDESTDALSARKVIIGIALLILGMVAGLFFASQFAGAH